MIIVEDRDIELDDRILEDFANHHKGALSVYNSNGDTLKSCFDIIFVRDNDDLVRVINLFSKVNISIFSSDENKDSFLSSKIDEPIVNNYLIKDGAGWRIQSHYLGSGMNVGSLEQCIDYITSSEKYRTTHQDYTRERIISRIEELKSGKALFDKNNNTPLTGYIRPKYSKDGRIFWEASSLLISELEALL